MRLHQEMEVYVSCREHSRMGVEVEERCWRVERRIRECRIWIEEEMSVPLAERIITSIGEKEELRVMSVSKFPDFSSFTSVIASRS